jgi:hypothetical protein
MYRWRPPIHLTSLTPPLARANVFPRTEPSWRFTQGSSRQHSSRSPSRAGDRKMHLRQTPVADDLTTCNEYEATEMKHLISCSPEDPTRTLFQRLGHFLIGSRCIYLSASTRPPSPLDFIRVASSIWIWIWIQFTCAKSSGECRCARMRPACDSKSLRTAQAVPLWHGLSRPHAHRGFLFEYLRACPRGSKNR